MLSLPILYAGYPVVSCFLSITYQTWVQLPKCIYSKTGGQQAPETGCIYLYFLKYETENRNNVSDDQHLGPQDIVL